MKFSCGFFRSVLLSFFLLALPQSLFAQDQGGDFSWLLSGGGLGADWAEDVAVDQGGEGRTPAFYLVGTISGDIDLLKSTAANETETETISAPGGGGNADILLVRYVQSANDSSVWELDTSWIKALGGTGSDSSSGVRVGEDGTVYLLGVFTNGIDLGNESLLSLFFQDAFVAAFSASGDTSWTLQIVRKRTSGDEVDTEITDLRLEEASERIYLSGYSANRRVRVRTEGVTRLFERGGGLFNEAAFVLRLTSDGALAEETLEESITIATNGVGSLSRAESLDIDAEGNAYIAGGFTGDVAFGDTTLSSAGGEDGFVAQVASTGGFGRAWKIGGEGEDTAAGLVVDSAGDLSQGLFVAGYLDSSSGGCFDQEGALCTVSQAADEGSKQFFVSRYTLAGEISSRDIATGNTLGSTSQITDLYLSSAGKVLFTGAGDGDVMLGQYDFSAADGLSLLWADFISSEGSALGRALTVRGEAEVLLCGGASGTVSFEGRVPDDYGDTEKSNLFLASYVIDVPSIEETTPQLVKSRVADVSEENPPEVEVTETGAGFSVSLPRFERVTLNRGAGAARVASDAVAEGRLRSGKINIRVSYDAKLERYVNGRWRTVAKRVLRRNQAAVKRLQPGTYQLSYRVLLKARGMKKSVPASKDYSPPREFQLTK